MGEMWPDRKTDWSSIYTENECDILEQTFGKVYWSSMSVGSFMYVLVD